MSLDKRLNPNTGKPFEPISDERLAELDSWYEKSPSNSLMFCDADYFEMSARLRVMIAELRRLTELESRVLNEEFTYVAPAGHQVKCGWRNEMGRPTKWWKAVKE